MNLPDQDDHVEVKDFHNEYLFISQAYAEQEFSRVKKLIVEGKLLSKIIDPQYKEVSFNLEISIVKRPNEKGYFLRSLTTNNEVNENLESILICNEVHSARKEAIRGYLRHSVAVSERYVLKLKLTESKNGISKEPEIEEFDIAEYGDFKLALDSANYVISWNIEPRLNRHFPEYDDNLFLELLLVEKQSQQEVEILIKNNDNYFPLGKGLKRELEDLSYLERLARFHGHKIPTYGSKTLLWDQPPKQKDYMLEDYDKIVDAITIWRELGYYYMVYSGKNWKETTKKRIFLHHDLSRSRQAALDFFDDVLQNKNPPEVISLVMLPTDLGTVPLVLSSTDPELQEQLVSDVEEEKKILRSKQKNEG